MNHIYRSIWSEALATWIAVSENTQGKAKSSSAKKNSCLTTASCTNVLATVLLLFSSASSALPTGEQVVAGQVQVSTANSTELNIQQNSQQAIINWQNFSIHHNEIVNVYQPNANAALLNRVIGQDASLIQGQLHANGQVYLINANGVLFDKTAQVDVGGLVASTHDIANADFLSEKYHFLQGTISGIVDNQGFIRTPDGGIVVLIGTQVSNAGEISTLQGTAALAAGKTVDLDFKGDGLVEVKVSEAALNAQINNTGAMIADAGRVVLTASAAGQLVNTVINSSGVLQAKSLSNRNGEIILESGDNGSIEINGLVNVSGEQAGGSIKVLANQLSGTVNVAGILDARALKNGDGGFIETSAAHVNIQHTAQILTSALQGKTGRWLLDPTDFIIAASGGNISGADLTANLANTDIEIASTADVKVNDVVSWSANQLTLNAAHNIAINANLNGSGTAKLALLYGQSSANGGANDNYSLAETAKINLAAGQNFSTQKGSDSVNLKNYTVITELGVAGDSSALTLQGMKNNVAGNFVLGGDIDASATSSWNPNGAINNGFVPIGDLTTAFSGSFDGLGHTISGLSINRPTMNRVGLFGRTETTANINNIGLINANIIGNFAVGSLVGENTGNINNSFAISNVSAEGTYIGGLVGANTVNGTINNSYAKGLVSSSAGYYIGGLVGANQGFISESYAENAVNGGFDYVGGLVGGNDSGGQIQHVYATGAVSNSGLYAGGLVGGNKGAIRFAYATGDVISSLDYVGGLVGGNDNSGSIDNVFATGNVTGRGYVGGLIGGNDSGISNAYAVGSVHGSLDNIGSLIGANGINGIVNNTYATGNVTGINYVGGLVGKNEGSISNSFWSRGATVETMRLSTFSSWGSNISANGGDTSVWRIYEGHTLPLLRSFLTPLMLTDAPDATLTYNGFVQNGASTAIAGVLGAAASGKNVGFYSGYYSTQQGYDLIGGNLTINKANLTVNGITATDKIYDTFNTANLLGTANVSAFSNDVVSLIGTGQAVFADKNVGTNKAVIVSGYTLSGADADNYTLLQPTGLTANITPLNLSINGISAINKVYDALNTAQLLGTATITALAGDSLILTGAGSGFFADKNVGSNKAVSVSGYTLSGTDANNYTLVQPSGLTANITPATLNLVSFIAADKVFDGTTKTTVKSAALSGVLGTDAVGITSNQVDFVDKFVGVKNVTLLNPTLTGADANNYLLTPVTQLVSLQPATIFADTTTGTQTTGSGDWADPTIWGQGAAPNANQDVVLNHAGGNVTLSRGQYEVLSLISNGNGVTISGGTLTAGNDVIFNGGALNFKDGGVLNATHVTLQNNAGLNGVGQINADVKNESGVISPGFSPGKIVITGNYTQESTGVLNIELGGLGSSLYDSLQISGNATLGGTLHITAIGGYLQEAQVGDSFSFLTAASFSGSFSSVTTLPGFAYRFEVANGGYNLITTQSPNSSNGSVANTVSSLVTALTSNSTATAQAVNVVSESSANNVSSAAVEQSTVVDEGDGFSEGLSSDSSSTSVAEESSAASTTEQTSSSSVAEETGSKASAEESGGSKSSSSSSSTAGGAKTSSASAAKTKSSSSSSSKSSKSSTKNGGSSHADAKQKDTTKPLVVPTLTVKNSAGRIKSMQMSANKQFLSLLLEDGSVRIWDFEKGLQRRLKLETTQQALSEVSRVDNNGELLLTVNKSGLNAYDVVSSILETSLKEEDIRHFTLSTDGQLLLLNTGENNLALWDNKQHKKLWQQSYKRGVINDLVLSDNKQYAAVLSYQPKAYEISANFSLKNVIDAVDIIDLATGNVLKSLPNFGESLIYLQFKDNNKLQLGLANGEIASWSIATQKLTTLARVAEPIVSVDSSGEAFSYVLKSGAVRVFDGKGNLKVNIKNSGQPFISAKLLDDGKRLLTAVQSGDVALWDVASGKKILKLFSTLQGWTVMDAFGRFDGAEEAMDNFTWVADDVEVSLDSLSENYYEPGLLSNVLQNQDYLNSDSNAMSAGISLPPKVAVQLAEQQAKGENVTVQLDVYDRGGGIDQINIFHNGRPLNNDSSIVAQQTLEEKGAEHRVLSLNIVPNPGKNTIKVIASNEMGIENSGSELSFDGATKAYSSSVRLLAVGVNNYKEKQLKLSFSVADATAFADSIKNRAKMSASKNLFNEDANKVKILAELKELSQGSPNDVLVVYFAGHGEVMGKEWYFLPYETELRRSLKETLAAGISATELSDVFKSSKIQHILLVVDACHSGGSMGVFSQLENGQRYFSRQLSRSLGITILTAAAKEQYAAELKSLGHGLFTYVLTQDIQNSGIDKPVTAHGIAANIMKALPAFSKKVLKTTQDPVVHIHGDDFILTDVIKESKNNEPAKQPNKTH